MVLGLRDVDGMEPSAWLEFVTGLQLIDRVLPGLNELRLFLRRSVAGGCGRGSGMKLLRLSGFSTACPRNMVK